MSQALYRKYRSKSLADVVGQDHITDILRRALETERVAHAYLFTGPRGVGKTSIARILAHEINKLEYSEDTQHLDIIEIDAASNNSVEDVRDLREKVQIAPVSAAKKVYIIDEVHMLSKQAFNALLKTLEEPPAHVVFILATTNAEKLPATIISRTQQYAFKAIKPSDAVAHLKHIAKQEKITITNEALAIIADRGDGSFRDSISLLDQLANLATGKEGITAELVESTLGLAPASLVQDLIKAVRAHELTTVAQLLEATESNGVSSIVIADQLIKTLRSTVASTPDLLPLLDALLEVARSSYPSIKLLSVLGSASLVHKPKSAALLAPVMEVTGTIEELAAQATRKTPHMKPVAKKVPGVAPFEGLFSWDTLIEHTHEHCVALYSVLKKCGHAADAESLTIYTINAFYKKKIDDPKYNVHLREALKAAGGYELDVHTVPTGAPMKSSQAASIADIMGGGTEVSLDGE